MAKSLDADHSTSGVVTFCIARSERLNAAQDWKIRIWGPNQACSQTTLETAKILGGNFKFASRPNRRSHGRHHRFESRVQNTALRAERAENVWFVPSLVTFWGTLIVHPKHSTLEGQVHKSSNPSTSFCAHILGSRSGDPASSVYCIDLSWGPNWTMDVLFMDLPPLNKYRSERPPRRPHHYATDCIVTS